MLRPLAAGGALLALLTSLISAHGAQAASANPAGPVPGRITVDVVTVNGSGCPRGTAAVAAAPDNTGFTVTYSDYTAVTGPSADPVDFRKNCQLSLRIHVPQGFTYAIAKADYRGFAHLESGADGLVQASYYFQGSSATAVVEHPLDGPMSDNWQVTDKTDWGQLVWAPCGVDRGFNINSELRAKARHSEPKKTSFVTMDSTDGTVSTKFHFAWKECPAKG